MSNLRIHSGPTSPKVCPLLIWTLELTLWRVNRFKPEIVKYYIGGWNLRHIASVSGPLTSYRRISREPLSRPSLQLKLNSAGERKWHCRQKAAAGVLACAAVDCERNFLRDTANTVTDCPGCASGTATHLVPFARCHTVNWNLDLVVSVPKVDVTK